MIHPIVITKVVRAAKALVRSRLVSVGLLPRSPVEVQVIPAPVQKELTHPWDRHEPGRSSGRTQPRASRPLDLRLTPMEQVENRQSGRFPTRRPGRETGRRAGRSSGR